MKKDFLRQNRTKNRPFLAKSLFCRLKVSALLLLKCGTSFELQERRKAARKAADASSNSNEANAGEATVPDNVKAAEAITKEAIISDNIEIAEAAIIPDNVEAAEEATIPDKKEATEEIVPKDRHANKAKDLVTEY